MIKLLVKLFIKDSENTPRPDVRSAYGTLCSIVGIVLNGLLFAGKFFACPGYPECKFTKPFVQETQGNCPICGNTVISKKSKKGHTFFGCSGFPTCTFMTWDTPTKDNCPDCGKTLFRSRGNVIKCLDENCGYEKKGSKKQEKDEN